MWKKGKAECVILRNNIGGNQDSRFISRKSLTPVTELQFLIYRSQGPAGSDYALELKPPAPVYSFHSVLSDMQRFLLCYLWLQHSIRLYWGGKTRGRLQKHGDPRQLQARHYTPAWRITINCLHRSKKIAPMKNECQLMWSLMRSWLNIIAREEKSERWFWVPGVTKTGGETETMRSNPMELDWLRLLVQFMGHHHVV